GGGEAQWIAERVAPFQLGESVVEARGQVELQGEAGEAAIGIGDQAGNDHVGVDALGQGSWRFQTGNGFRRRRVLLADLGRAQLLEGYATDLQIVVAGKLVYQRFVDPAGELLALF